jgi:hypothetical protein
MELNPPNIQSLTVFEWDYGAQPNVPKEWCLWNADGSFYVNWDVAFQLAMYPEPTTPENVMTVCHVMMARLLIAARGKFTEVTRDEARRIAKDAGERCNEIGRHTGVLIRPFPR